MTAKNNKIQRAINLELTETEIQILESDPNFSIDVNLMEKADFLSQELMLPGYSKLVEQKSNEIAALLNEGTANNSEKKPINSGKISQSIIIKLMGIAAIFLLVISINQFLNPSSSDRQLIGPELERLAINSFDNSGLLHSKRSSSDNEQKLFLYNAYQKGALIADEDCTIDRELCKLTNAVTHIKAKNYTEAISTLNAIGAYTEIKNKLLLYSYYQMEDKRYLENLDIITKNKFPNYTLINELLE